MNGLKEIGETREFAPIDDHDDFKSKHVDVAMTIRKSGDFVGINWRLIHNIQKNRGNPRFEICETIFFAYHRGVHDSIRAQIEAEKIVGKAEPYKPEKKSSKWDSFVDFFAFIGMCYTLASLIKMF